MEYLVHGSEIDCDCGYGCDLDEHDDGVSYCTDGVCWLMDG